MTSSVTNDILHSEKTDTFPKPLFCHENDGLLLSPVFGT